MAAPTVCLTRRLLFQLYKLPKVLAKQKCLWLLQNISTRQYYTNIREVKKFYRNASIATADGWYEINLDKRKLRTPAGSLFRVPNEALALAVATEWNSQDKTIKRHAMHLTNLCNTALDNPLQQTREDLTESIVRFLEIDTICYRMTEPVELVDMQVAEWDPILQWASDRYKISVESTYGIAPPFITDESKEVIRRHLMVYSDWALFGYHSAVDAIKSLLLVMAVVDHHIDVERTVELAALEQIFQTKQWGRVEWYHDIGRYELQSRLAAATLFVHWCSESTSVRQKASLAIQ